MPKIKQLDDQLANKIAAGEVVERPASVVKELVENAIDANSTRVEINVEEAGLMKIQIIDNGDGIEEEDCLIAFERHATSKIKDENDLFRIRTLGFRGEALPSIASVSEVELKTSTGDGPGTYLLIKGGKVVKKEAANSRKGTEITVENLFFNTPARLKHLKTIHTELGNITDVVNRIALAHPEVSIRLLHNGKKLLYTNGNGEVLQVLAAIYGMSVAKKMIPLNLESIDFSISGYIAKPEVTRASRNYLSIMINGRFIKNYPLAKAIQQGYHTLLPIGRYPICLIDIKMDPLLVDVNVHPAKLEVRLSKESELTEMIDQGIKKAFRHLQLIPEMERKKRVLRIEEEQQTFELDHAHRYDTVDSKLPKVEYTEPEPQATGEAFKVNEEDFVQPQVKHFEDSFENIGELELESNIRYDLNDDSKIVETNEAINEEIGDEANYQERIPPLYPIGQMHGTYILCQNESGLYVIDQHAAQERVKYEFYREKVGEVKSEVQELLVPLTFEFTQQECLTIEEHMNELKSVGIFLESFGPQAYIVRSHPQWFPKGAESEIIEEVVQQVITDKKADIKALREEAAIMMSCKASIKANQHLRNDEMFALLESLRKSTDPFTCPHGRPIIIHFSTYEIEKLFKRVM